MASVGHRDVAQLGSASALGAEGRRFKSCHPDHVVLATTQPPWSRDDWARGRRAASGTGGVCHRPDSRTFCGTQSRPIPLRHGVDHGGRPPRRPSRDAGQWCQRVGGRAVLVQASTTFDLRWLHTARVDALWSRYGFDGTTLLWTSRPGGQRPKSSSIRSNATSAPTNRALTRFQEPLGRCATGTASSRGSVATGCMAAACHTMWTAGRRMPRKSLTKISGAQGRR